MYTQTPACKTAGRDISVFNSHRHDILSNIKPFHFPISSQPICIDYPKPYYMALNVHMLN